MIEVTSEMVGAFMRAYSEADNGSADVILHDKAEKAGLAAVLAIVERDQGPTLAAALDTLPAEDEQYLAWMRRHGLGHGAGIAVVISSVRSDLRQLITSSSPSGVDRG